MSIFDNYSDKNLPGDKAIRKVKNLSLEHEYQNDDDTDADSNNRPNFWPLYTVAVIVAFVLIAQLLKLQITQGSFNRTLAEGNRIRNRDILAPRGIIYDSKGIPLVNNDASFCLVIYPQDLPKKEAELKNFFENVSEIIQTPADEIKNIVKEKGLNRADPIILKENIDRDTALLLEVKTVNTPGLVVEKRPIRNYINSAGLSAVLGYVGKVTENEMKNNPALKLSEPIGKDGLEKIYQDYLQGENGITEIEVDAHGRTQRIVSNKTPKPGKTMVLNIDSKLQEYLTTRLQQELEASDVKAGAAVAINPQTGGILSMVSLPTYDNNIFSKNITAEDYQNLINDANKPLFNRNVSGTYPSGSTIKPFVASAGLQEGVITENTTINDPGEIKVGSWSYPDWKTHGLVDVRKAIAESCNVFFYAVGGGWDKIPGLGVEKLRSYLDKFGFGQNTGIDLPNEASGLLPSPQWKEKTKHETWYLGDTYHMAIGQGDVLATPLQMAVATASVANGGELLKPFIVSQIKDGDQIILENNKEVIRKDYISSDNIAVVRQGMRQAVTSGSASALGDLPVEVAAKTGTAQFGSEGKTHAWMIAFAPYDNPTIAIAVLVEGGGEGYATAGPVVKDTLNYLFTR